MDNAITVSVIMPSLNSEATIETSLDSIRRQTLPMEEVEIILADGGSHDRTREIALRYGARIVENKKVQQEYGKHLGLVAARGHYAVFLDTDEVIQEKDSLQKKITAMQSVPECHVLLPSGYKKPPGLSAINDYINWMADPFAYFIYRDRNNRTTGPYITALRKHYSTFFETDEFQVFAWKANQLPPLSDMAGGVMVDIHYIKRLKGYSDQDPSYIPSIFNEILHTSGLFGIMKRDAILHYSIDSFRRYLLKLNWRVKANIFFASIPGTGYANRDSYHTLIQRIKKYFFIPYSLTLVIPLIESIYYAFKTRNLIFLMHPVFAFYTGFTILYYYTLKLLGVRPRLKAYGKGDRDLQLSNEGR